MGKVEDAKKILQAIGMPKTQQTLICAFSLLAMANIREASDWNTASASWIRIHDILMFIREEFGVKYAENSRETFRKQALHHFRNAALIEDNSEPTNSPNYRYRLTIETQTLLRSFSSATWESELAKFLRNHKTLIEVYTSKKEVQKMPVQINGEDYTFSTGDHNLLQKAIIEEFAPRFAHNCTCLYVGDTIEKDLVKNIEKLNTLGFEITLHDKMPDVVLFREDKQWLYFIEAVTSVGPMDPKRISEINTLTRNVKAGKIFVTAFLDFNTYKKFSPSLAWETEVWIAEMPDHMIHLNGDKFLGPR